MFMIVLLQYVQHPLIIIHSSPDAVKRQKSISPTIDKYTTMSCSCDNQGNKAQAINIPTA